MVLQLQAAASTLLQAARPGCLTVSHRKDQLVTSQHRWPAGRPGQPSDCHTKWLVSTYSVQSRQQKPWRLSPVGASGRKGQTTDTTPSSSASSNSDGDDYKYQNPLFAALGRLMPSQGAATLASGKEDKADGDGGGGGRAAANKLTGLSIQEMSERIRAGIQNDKWTTTGRIQMELFSDDFVFKDPDVTVRGIEKYAAGVAGLFDASSEADVISVEVEDKHTVKVDWRLAAAVKLPLGIRLQLKPYVVTTRYQTDAAGLICQQEDTFSIPGWEILLSALVPGVGTPPTPPVKQPAEASR